MAFINYFIGSNCVAILYKEKIKMKNDDNTILWIVGIVIVVFLILPKLQIQEQEDFVAMKVHYYDKDMKEIFPETYDKPKIDYMEALGIKFKRLIYSAGLFSIGSTSITSSYAANIQDDCSNAATSDFIYNPQRVEIYAYHEETGYIAFPTTSIPAGVAITSVYIQSYSWMDEDPFLRIGWVDPTGTNFNPGTSSGVTDLCNKIRYAANRGADGNQMYYAQPSGSTGSWQTRALVFNNIANTRLKTVRDNNQDFVVGITNTPSTRLHDFDFMYQQNPAMKPILKITYCQPDTCSSLGKNCGVWDNSCSGTVDCGTPEPGYSCIDGTLIPDITWISFEITAMNIGDVPFKDMSFSSASPVELLNALNLTDTRDLGIAQTQTWYSENITIKEEWSSSTIFDVCVSGISTYTDQTITKCDTLSGLQI